MPHNDSTLQDLILAFRAEVRADIQALREDFQANVVSTTSRITALETQTRPLFPNGQPGLIAEMRKDISDLKGKWRFVKGYAAGIFALLSTEAYLLFHFLGSK